MADGLGIIFEVATEHMSAQTPTNINEIPGDVRVAIRVTIMPGQGALPHYHPTRRAFDPDEVDSYMQINGRAIVNVREIGRQVWRKREINAVRRNLVVRPGAHHCIFVPKTFAQPFVMIVSTRADHVLNVQNGGNIIYLPREEWSGNAKIFWREFPPM